MTKDFTYPEEAKQQVISRTLRAHTAREEYVNRLLAKVFGDLTLNRPPERAEIERSRTRQGPSMDVFDTMTRETYRANDIQHNAAAPRPYIMPPGLIHNAMELMADD